MRKPLILLFLTLSFSGLYGQTLPEKSLWQGQLGQLRLVLRVFPDSLSGIPKAVFDSPDQNVTNLAVSEFRITADSLLANSKVIGGGFAGKFNSEKTQIEGFWKQGKFKGPLTLIKITSLAKAIARPQTPLPPFPYKSENVEYNNSANTVHFGATLTLPNTTKPCPVVILISGSGQQDRDETIYNHKPFAVLADHLTRNGIAVLRVDDRGVGLTTGEIKNATTAHFTKDVLAGIDYVKTRKEIDSRQIGLIGHSEGGMIAPMAVNQSGDVAFMVSMAGLGVSGNDLLKKQNADLLKVSNLPADQYKALVSLYSRMFDKVKSLDLNKSLNLKAEFISWKTKQPQPLLDSMKLNEGQPGAEKIRLFEDALALPWMRYFIKYNPDIVLNKIKIPVLAINGSKDIQVSSAENLAGFNRLLKKAGNKDFKTIELPGLNHLFQTAVTGYPDEYAAIDETLAPVVLQVITDWIKKHTR